MAADPAVQARAKQIRAELGDPKTVILGRRPARLHQGHRAAAQGVPRAALRRQADRAGRGDGAGRHAEPGAGRALPGAAGQGGARGRPDQRRVRPGRRARRALPAPVVQSQRAGRAVLRGRRHDGDPAARRHESGGQGVRGGARRPRRRAGAQRVRRRRRPSCGRRSCATRTTPTGSRTRCCARSHVDPAEARAPDARHAAAPAHPRRRALGRGRSCSELGVDPTTEAA